MSHEEQAKSPSSEVGLAEGINKAAPQSGRSWVKVVRASADQKAQAAAAGHGGPGARTLGTAKGEFTVPQDFDAPLTESELEEFEQ